MSSQQALDEMQVDLLQQLCKIMCHVTIIMDGKCTSLQNTPPNKTHLSKKQQHLFFANAPLLKVYQKNGSKKLATQIR